MCVWVGVSLSSSALCIVHCVGCSAADYFSWAEICFQWVGGGEGEFRFLCAYWGDPLLGGDLASIHKCLLCRSCQNTPWRNTWDALRAGAVQKRQSHTRPVFPGYEVLTAEKEQPADELHGKTSSCAESEAEFSSSVQLAWWWSWVVGKTSFTQRSAVPLACSCPSPVVVCALDCVQTTACDSLCNVRGARVEVGVPFDSVWRHTCKDNCQSQQPILSVYSSICHRMVYIQYSVSSAACLTSWGKLHPFG